MTRRLLAVRLDSAGDVLVTGPALRAMASASDELIVLAGPQGVEAAELLPGVRQVLRWECPWIMSPPAPVDRATGSDLVETLAGLDVDEACIFTSFHQSALPTALLLRQAGIRRIAGISEDYPGSLLDVRHRVEEEIPEPERALSLALAAGFDLPAGDDGRLRVSMPLAPLNGLAPPEPYVVLHPGTSVPSRAWPVTRFAETADLLRRYGWAVVVTGTPAEQYLAEAIVSATPAASEPPIHDLTGRTSFAELAAVLARASALVVANTGPAHLSAAVGTPVVSLFAPTVPAVKWAPYGVPRVLLGDQGAACRDSRATHCPVPGHPCLNSVTAHDVLTAVDQLIGPAPMPAGSVPVLSKGAP